LVGPFLELNSHEGQKEHQGACPFQCPVCDEIIVEAWGRKAGD